MAAPAIATPDTPVVHRAALAVLFGAALAGFVASFLVPSGPLGFGFTLTTFCTLAIYGLLARFSFVRPQPKANGLWVGIILFALLIAGRDSTSIRFLNLLAMALFAGILAIRARPSMISKGSVFDYPIRALGAWLVAFVDTFNLILNDIAWRLIPQGGNGKHVAAGLRGLLLATPLVLVFGVLFASADANFERLLTNLFTFDLETLLVQGFIGFAFFWFTAGLFRRVYIGQPEVKAPPSAINPPPTLGTLEISIILGSLNILFILFVATQWPYFFGGAETLRATTDLSVAEFARRGFFELVAVSALALPTLLGLHALIDPESVRQRRVYRVLASVLLLLLTVVMLSAALKMKLYLETFQLSTLRVYVAAALVWLGLVFGWFSLTVLRERANRFAWGGAMLFAGMVVGLNVLNPDALVARWNLQAGKSIDWAYLRTLSADAAPVLRHHLDRAPLEEREHLRDRLNSFRHTSDWRSLNLSTLAAARP